MLRGCVARVIVLCIGWQEMRNWQGNGIPSRGSWKGRMCKIGRGGLVGFGGRRHRLCPEGSNNIEKTELVASYYLWTYVLYMKSYHFWNPRNTFVITPVLYALNARSRDPNKNTMIRKTTKIEREGKRVYHKYLFS